jgi:hypothetical protein
MTYRAHHDRSNKLDERGGSCDSDDAGPDNSPSLKNFFMDDQRKILT